LSAQRPINFGGFSLDVSAAWGRVLDTWGNIADKDRPPYSVVRQKDGIGVLQLAPALHGGGVAPSDVDSANLLKMAEDFGKRRGLGPSSDQAIHDDEYLAIGALSFFPQDKFIRVWFVSDGLNFLFITYGCLAGQQQTELPDCETMARSVKFDSTWEKDPAT
jgi:hypothetical protein